MTKRLDSRHECAFSSKEMHVLKTHDSSPRFRDLKPELLLGTTAGSFVTRSPCIPKGNLIPDFSVAESVKRHRDAESSVQN